MTQMFLIVFFFFFYCLCHVQTGVALNVLAMFLSEYIVGNIGRKTVLSAKTLPHPSIY